MLEMLETASKFAIGYVADYKNVKKATVAKNITKLSIL